MQYESRHGSVSCSVPKHDLCTRDDSYSHTGIPVYAGAQCSFCWRYIAYFHYEKYAWTGWKVAKNTSASAASFRRHLFVFRGAFFSIRLGILHTAAKIIGGTATQNSNIIIKTIGGTVTTTKK